MSPPATAGSTLDPAGLAEIVVALAKLGVSPSAAWTSSFLAAVSEALPRFDAAALSGVVWGVAMLELPLPAGWWEQVLARVAEVLDKDPTESSPVVTSKVINRDGQTADLELEKPLSKIAGKASSTRRRDVGNKKPSASVRSVQEGAHSQQMFGNSDGRPPSDESVVSAQIVKFPQKALSASQ